MTTTTSDRAWHVGDRVKIAVRFTDGTLAYWAVGIIGQPVPKEKADPDVCIALRAFRYTDGTADRVTRGHSWYPLSRLERDE